MVGQHLISDEDFMSELQHAPAASHTKGARGRNGVQIKALRVLIFTLPFLERERKYLLEIQRLTSCDLPVATGCQWEQCDVIERVCLQHHFGTSNSPQFWKVAAGFNSSAELNKGPACGTWHLSLLRPFCRHKGASMQGSQLLMCFGLHGSSPTWGFGCVSVRFGYVS